MHFRVRPLLFDQPLGETIDVRAMFMGRVLSPGESPYSHQRASLKWVVGMARVGLGIDLGGTKTLVGVPGEPPLTALTPLAFDESLQTLLELSRAALKGRSCDRIGVAIGGPIDHRRRTVSPLHQPEWRDIPLWEILKGEFGVEPTIEVDTDAAAFAEARHRSAKDLFYVTWSTGVGGGYVREGEVYRSLQPTGATHPEFGHQMVGDAGGATGGCGNPGCLESLIGGRAIEERFGITAAELPEERWAELEQLMAVGIINASTLLGCSFFVLGGSIGVARYEGVLTAANSLQSRCSLSLPLRIERSDFGALASFQGALYLADKGSPA